MWKVIKLYETNHIPTVLLYTRTYIPLYENKGAATPYIFILGGACVMSVLLQIEFLTFVSHYSFCTLY
jgi:hypothetical protein